VAGDADSWSRVTGSTLPLPDDGSRTGTFEDCLEEFYGWYVDLYDEPTTGTGSAWDPTRLEYRFAVSTGAGETEAVFEAPEYQGGHLDWYAFSATDGSLDPSTGRGTSTDGGEEIAPPVDPSIGTPQVAESLDTDLPDTAGQADVDLTEVLQYAEEHPTTVRQRTLLPSQVSFPGMPAARWWELEDSNVDLAQIRARSCCSWSLPPSTETTGTRSPSRRRSGRVRASPTWR
jgi:hypothetical protein